MIRYISTLKFSIYIIFLYIDSIFSYFAFLHLQQRGFFLTVFLQPLFKNNDRIIVKKGGEKNKYRRVK